MTTYRTDWFVPQQDGRLLEGRFVYPYLAKKRANDFQNKPLAPGEQYYETTILFPKSASDSLQGPYVGPRALVEKVWQAWCMDPKSGNQWRQGARWPIEDCDVVQPGQTKAFAAEKEWARGCWRIAPWSMFPPRVVDQANNEIPKDMYGEFAGFKSGDYGVASLNCFAYQTGTGGVNFGIEGVKKTRDGDPVGGGQRSPEQMFGGAAPVAAPPLPAAYAPGAASGPSYAAPPQYAQQQMPSPTYGAPQPGFPQGAATQQPQYAPQPGAPATPAYATAPSTGGAPSYPSSGQPVYGGAPPTQPGYPPPPQQGMPPAPPPPFGGR
jgi:hypothetical protein